TIIHALLTDPEARYQDLGADYYEQRMHARRQARSHVQSLERLGYKVTIQALNPPPAAPRPRRRPLPHAQPRSYFRTREQPDPCAPPTGRVDIRSQLRVAFF